MIPIRVWVDRDASLSLKSLFTADRDQGRANRDHSLFLGQFFVFRLFGQDIDLGIVRGGSRG